MVALPRLVVAAPSTGQGETTIATGLMAALRIAGHEVSGHKVGPDYIDPGYHALATGRPGRNLDPHLVGEERLVAWADRYGKWLTLRGKEIKQADDWFDRHGPRAVLFGRMVPGIRSLLSLPAGMSEMPLPKFLIYSAIGSGLWASALAGAGYLLGENYDRVEQYISPVSKIVLGVVVVAAVVWFLRRKRAQTARS